MVPLSPAEIGEDVSCGQFGCGRYLVLPDRQCVLCHDVPPIHSVKAEVTASVEDGPVRVYLVAPDGTETSAEVKPGSPATISGPAKGHVDEFRIYFEALEGTASGVNFTVSYTYP